MHTSTSWLGHRGAGHLISRATRGIAGTVAAAGLLLAAAAPAHAATTNAYTKPGTYTFTVPQSISKIKVVLTGAGGGGGGSTYGNPPIQTGGGNGGGGGATQACTLDVHPGDTLTITVGAGGAANGMLGTDGTNSTITYPNAAGASAEGGHAGMNYDQWPNGSGGGFSATWCAGTDASQAFGQGGSRGGLSNVNFAGGAGGTPGAGVHSACPVGTGVGGKGGDGPTPRDGVPGGNGCVVLTY